MTRVEHDDWKCCDCPCGKGQITKHVSSTDYAFSSAEVSHTLDCSACCLVWRLEYSWLVNRESERDYITIASQAPCADRKANLICRKLIDTYFELVGFQHKTEELRELHKLHLSSLKYPAYSRSRRDGQTPGQIAVFKTKKGMLTIFNFASAEEEAEIRALLDVQAKYDRRLRLAAEKIVRRRFECSL